MELSFFGLIISCLIGFVLSAGPNHKLHTRRQFPGVVNVQKRVDGNLVFGTSNDEAVNGLPVEAQFNPNQIPQHDGKPHPVVTESEVSLSALNKIKPVTEEPGVIDSIFGDGVQSRIVSSLSGWALNKAKENPGCVERFVCETYRTGETMSGFPYFLMQLTNAAVSFMVADMFDGSVDIKEITRAARHGRDIGSCHTMKCDFMDGQLRTLGDYFETVEEFISSLYNSLANSINIGK